MWRIRPGRGESRSSLRQNQHETELVRQSPQAVQIAGFRLDNPDVLQDGLRNESSDRISLTDIPDRIEVIEIYDMYKTLVFWWDSGADGFKCIFSGANSVPSSLRGVIRLHATSLCQPL